MPFNEDIFQKTAARKLKFGYVCFARDGKLVDGVESLPISKATIRAMAEVRSALQA